MQKYRVKMLIAIQQDGVFAHRNEILQGEPFELLDEALEYCKVSMAEKLSSGNYFRSQIYGFDLVRYRNLCSQNTYIAYRIAIQNINRALVDEDFVALTYI